jgi:hypothetical protein
LSMLNVAEQSRVGDLVVLEADLAAVDTRRLFNLDLLDQVLSVLQLDRVASEEDSVAALVDEAVVLEVAASAKEDLVDKVEVDWVIKEVVVALHEVDMVGKQMEWVVASLRLMHPLDPEVVGLAVIVAAETAAEVIEEGLDPVGMAALVLMGIVAGTLLRTTRMLQAGLELL